MTNAKLTKRALVSSILSLVLCVSMFVGTTFAWFTDSVTSANNIIQSGNLNIELYYQTEGQSDWTKVTETTNVFKENTLWEPGHTEVVKLKVVNEGSLTLKYNLGVNVADETGSINVNNEPFKLSDYIKFGIVDGAQTYTREEAIAAAEANNATALKTAYNSGTTVLEAKNDTDTDEKVVTMVVYMPTTVGNEANAKAGAPVPTIHLGINLVATQMTSENDSFGNDYDVNAPYSLWNGVVPTEMPASLVVDGATQTIHVKDADALVYLTTLSEKWVELYTDGNGRDFNNYANGAGADYYYSDRWTVSLEADIDLGNYPISPLEIFLAESTGASTFDGNFHTIRNIKTTTGLFADNNRTSYTDLTLENVKATGGALTGSANTKIVNVIVKNATISGTDYVGGLVGYFYDNAENCKVMDSSVVATGKEAGGLFGYAAASVGTVITGNTVKNVSVYAGNRAAGLIAQVNINVKVYGNTIDTVTVGATDTTTYQPNAVVSNALDVANVYNNTVKNADVVTSTIDIVATQADFKETINNATDGTAIVLTGDVTASATDWDRYTGGMSKSVSIDGCGNTIKILTQITDPNYQAVLRFEKDAVIKNVVFDLSEANPNGGKFRAISAKGDLVVDNCTFIGNPAISNTRGIIFGEASGSAIGEVDVTITNCTFIDFRYGISDNENGQDAKSVKIENCKFINAGVNVSASESITFTGNEVVNSSVRLVSYQNGATVKVVATGNDVTESAGQVLAIMKITNTANIEKQDEFTIA